MRNNIFLFSLYVFCRCFSLCSCFLSLCGHFKFPFVYLHSFLALFLWWLASFYCHFMTESLGSFSNPCITVRQDFITLETLWYLFTLWGRSAACIWQTNTTSCQMILQQQFGLTFFSQPRIVVVLNLTAGLYWVWTWPKCQTSSFKVQYSLLDVRRRLINCIKSLILGVNNENVVSVLQKWPSGGVVLSGLEKVMRKAGKDPRYEARGKKNDCTWVQFRLLVLDSAVLLLVWFKLCCIKPVDFRIFKLQRFTKMLCLFNS